ncbi:MAG: hypothetical protein WC477_01920 [Patescibacteria group bacterium]
MTPLLTFSYWFSLSPQPFQPIVERVLLAVFAVMAIAGIACYLVPLKRGMDKGIKRALLRLGALLTWSGILALCLWFFSWQAIPMLSMRALYLPIAVWIVWGIVLIARSVWVDLPAQRKAEAERMERERWLPKKSR